jgi:hypothetical protein
LAESRNARRETGPSDAQDARTLERRDDLVALALHVLAVGDVHRGGVACAQGRDDPGVPAVGLGLAGSGRL